MWCELINFNEKSILKTRIYLKDANIELIT